MLYGNRSSYQKIERGKAPLCLYQIFFLLFVDVTHRMHVTSFGQYPRAGSTVLIIMDRSYYGLYTLPVKPASFRTGTNYQFISLHDRFLGLITGAYFEPRIL